MRRNLFTLLLIVGIAGLAAYAQSPQPEDDLQSWNDVQITVPLTKKLDFQTTVTMRLGKNISRLNDGRFAVGVVWKPHALVSINPFYWYINARNANSQFRTEQRWNIRGTVKFPIKRFGLSHRSWFEYRIRSPLNSWRYRPSLTFEKDIPKKLVSGAKLYVTEEVFYDSLLKRFSRNRFTVGINKTLTKQLSLDLYYMRQNDGVSRPGDLHVIGTAWRVKL